MYGIKFNSIHFPAVFLAKLKQSIVFVDMVNNYQM